MHEGKSPEKSEKRQCFQGNLKEVDHLQNYGQIELFTNTNKQVQNPKLDHAGSPFPHLVAQPMAASEPKNTLKHMNQPKDPSREGSSEEGQPHLDCSLPGTTRDKQVKYKFDTLKTFTKSCIYRLFLTLLDHHTVTVMSLSLTKQMMILEHLA